MDKSYFCLLVLLFPIVACTWLWRHHKAHKRREGQPQNVKLTRLQRHQARDAEHRRAVEEQTRLHPYWGTLPSAMPRRPTPAQLLPVYEPRPRAASVNYFGFNSNSSDSLARSMTGLPPYSPMSPPGTPVLPWIADADNDNDSEDVNLTLQ
ncbi:hypothetical protein Sste5346_004130 [Sporothrix stenoceras]|uniref:Uncharacterized protein n=1 Tax=Sporothrix stenoceras TaxID=5173 RepID=A0ABR3ZD11_9PEZI